MTFGLHDTSLLVVTDLLFEEVGLALEGDHFHEVEGVGDIEVLFVAEGDEEAISDELDVLGHQVGVHADQADGEGVADEVLLHGDGVEEDLFNAFLGELVLEVLLVEEGGEVAVEAFIAGDVFVGEGEAGHQAALLEPEDGAEGAGEEDALDGGEGDEALSEGGGGGDPLDGPVGLALDAGDGFDGVEEAGLFLGVLDVGVEEEGVGFGVDVFDGDLEAVEAAGFGDLDVVHEAASEVLEDDAVGGGEEGEDVLDEVAFVVGEVLPVLLIGGEVDVGDGPDRGLSFLVHLPDVLVLDGEEDEAVGVVLEEGFVLHVGEVRAHLGFGHLGVFGVVLGVLEAVSSFFAFTRLADGELGRRRSGGLFVGRSLRETGHFSDVMLCFEF